ncbi:MAG: sulfurtransferase TusA family protein [Thermodesulfobacteriota bacterium]|nr:sulfurtransferase TusA family protein [Thermodesulfobacteriota bacterium]
MAIEFIDTLGMRSPQPILEIAVRSPDMRSGDILQVLGDCPTFEEDVLAWCERLGKMPSSTKNLGLNKKQIQIRF